MNKELKQLMDKIERDINYKPVKLHRCYWDRAQRRYIYIRERPTPTWYTELVESVKKKTFIEKLCWTFLGRGFGRTAAQITHSPRRKSRNR